MRQVADLCGITVQAVYKWEKSGKVPADYCRMIEAATNGEVTRYEMRPDVFGESPFFVSDRRSSERRDGERRQSDGAVQ